MPHEEAATEERSHLPGLLGSGGSDASGITLPGGDIGGATLPGDQPAGVGASLAGSKEAPQGAIGRLLDILLRGQFASARFARGLLRGELPPEASARGVLEAISPQERLSYSDIIQEDFGITNPVVVNGGGLVADIALDPTTYITFGVGTNIPKIGLRGIRVAQALGKAGPRAAKTGRALTEGIESVATKKVEKRAAEQLGEGARDTLARADIFSEQASLSREGMAALRQIERSIADAADPVELERRFARVLEREQLGIATGSRQARQFQAVTEDAQRQFAQRDLGARQKLVAEWEFSQLLASEPDKITKFLHPGGVRFAGKTVVSSNSLAKIRAAVPFLEQALSTVKELPPTKVLARTFRRNFGLPKAYVRLRDQLENSAKAVERRVSEEVGTLYAEVPTEARKRIRTFLADLDGETRRTLKEFRDVQPIDDAAERSIAQALKKRATDEALISGKLNQEDLVVISRFNTAMGEAAQLEGEAGLLKRLLANYTPRRFARMNFIQRTARRARGDLAELPTPYTPGNERRFIDDAQAIAAGFEPVDDLAALHATRLIEGQRAIRYTEFNEVVEALFGRGKTAAVKPKATIGGALKEASEFTLSGDLKGTRRFINDDLTFIGYNMLREGGDFARNAIRNFYLKQLQFFKKAATTFRPQFSGRQTLSNFAQNYLVLGPAATIKSLPGFSRTTGDPSAFVDSLMILWGKPQHADVVSGTGIRYRGEEVRDLALDFGVIRGMTIADDGPSGASGVVRLGISVGKRLERVEALRGLRRPENLKGAMRGLRAALTESTRYTHIPAFVEDTSRLTHFMSALRAGFSPEMAARSVDKALFNYLNGLSRIEEQFIKRIIPFYSFQRFAVPMLAEVIAKNPGRVINPVKAASQVFDAFGKLRGEEPLTEAERHVFPGWLMEQPTRFSGLDERQRAIFQTYNNMTPYDVVNALELTPSGNIDWRRTTMKGVLSAITPHLKVPLELAVERQFFTERILDDANPRNLRKVNPEALLTMLTAYAAGGVGGPKAALAGTAAAGAVARLGLSDDVLRLMLGYEVGRDPQTGEEVAYINPFQALVLPEIIPGLNDAFKLAQDDLSPLEKAQRFLFGINTFKLDMARERARRMEDLRRERDEEYRKLRKALREGRESSFSRTKRELEELMPLLEKRAELLTSSEVRRALTEEEAQ